MQPLGCEGLGSTFDLVFMVTLPEANIAPENGPLEKEIPMETLIFRGYVLVLGSVTCSYSMTVTSLPSLIFRCSMV